MSGKSERKPARPFRSKPCGECPWRKDQPAGRFPPERYIALAPTAYDMSQRLFACHKSPEGREVACAGWLTQSAGHSLSVRLWIIRGIYRPGQASSGGHALHKDFRAVAVFNGVAPNHPALKACRGRA
jgi:hypothetical protein